MPPWRILNRTSRVEAASPNRGYSILPHLLGLNARHTDIQAHAHTHTHSHTCAQIRNKDLSLDTAAFDSFFFFFFSSSNIDSLTKAYQPLGHTHAYTNTYTCSQRAAECPCHDQHTSTTHLTSLIICVQNAVILLLDYLSTQRLASINTRLSWQRYTWGTCALCALRESAVQECCVQGREECEFWVLKGSERLRIEFTFKLCVVLRIQFEWEACKLRLRRDVERRGIGSSLDES